MELARHLLAEDLRERVGGLRAQRVLLVDRGVVRAGVSNGRPSVVSLEAHTTRSRPRRAAAANTVYVLVMFVRKVRSGVATTGEGIAARWTTASMPGSRSPPLIASSVWP